MPKSTQIKKLLDTETKIELRDPIQIASCFNKHFTQIGPQLANAIPTETHMVINQSASYKAFHIQPVDEQNILDEIKKLNDKKAEGIDRVPAKLVKICSDYIVSPLVDIIHICISSGTFLDAMKGANVLPIYKNRGSSFSCNNYRPISVLPVFSKIFEKNKFSDSHSY